MRDRPDSLMIFAAGLGTRMRDLTRYRPKPLLTVGGKALLDHALDLGRDFGARHMVCNTHYLADQVRGHLAETGVLISHEERLLDTGGGLVNALPLLGQRPLFTLNSDVVWNGPNPLECLADHWDPDRMDALLLLVPMAQTVARTAPGDFHLDAMGRPGRGGDLVYTGAQIIAPSALDGFPAEPFSLNRVWDMLMARDRVSGCLYPGRWCDVGHPEGLAAAEALLEEAGG